MGNPIDAIFSGEDSRFDLSPNFGRARYMIFMFYVYLVKNLKNDMRYIGKAINPTARWTRHKTVASGDRSTYGSSFSYLHAAMKKYGPDNFEFSILESYTNNDQALLGEMSHIKRLKSSGYKLYNLTDGGEGLIGYRHSEESKKKFSGKNNPNFGKPMSGLRKERFKFSAKGSGHPLFGLPVSQETRNKISVAKTNSPNKFSKLTWNDVNRIRELFSQGISATKVARQFPQVHENTIFGICSGRTWKVKNVGEV